MQEKLVLAFGAFDGLHEGHRFFLRSARALGGRLIVSVAADETVEGLKKHPPRAPQGERIAKLMESGLVDAAIPGDTVLGNWTAIMEHRPDIIALGYDQTRLKETLEAFLKERRLSIELKVIPPFEPERFHSSLLP